MSLNDFLQKNGSGKLVDDRIFFAPRIPEKKLANAAESHEMPRSDIIVLVDDTAFGGAKDGICFTSAALSVKPMFERPLKFDYRNVRTVECVRNHFLVNGADLCKLSLPDREAMAALTELVQRYIREEFCAGAGSTTSSHRSQAPQIAAPNVSGGPVTRAILQTEESIKLESISNPSMAALCFIPLRLMQTIRPHVSSMESEGFDHVPGVFFGLFTVAIAFSALTTAEENDGEEAISYLQMGTGHVIDTYEKLLGEPQGLARKLADGIPEFSRSRGGNQRLRQETCEYLEEVYPDIDWGRIVYDELNSASVSIALEWRRKIDAM